MKQKTKTSIHVHKVLIKKYTNICFFLLFKFIIYQNWIWHYFKSWKSFM